MSFKKITQLSSLSAFAALSFIGATIATAQTAAPGSASALAATLPPSALTSAKTISVHEDFILYSKDGKPSPFFHNTVLIRRPNQVKVIVAQTKPNSKPHLYVANGKTEYEYNALTNQYNVVTPRPDGRSASQLRDMSRIDLILNTGHLAAPKVGVDRTITSETVDGKDMILVADTAPAKTGSDGSLYAYPTKIWFDAKTGFPYRWLLEVTKDGVTAPEQEVDFSEWALNVPLKAAQFAWAPPVGSKPFSEPVLLPVGYLAPDFAVTMPDGNLAHLSDFKGKTVVLDFWATWCGPCQKSMPHLEHVYQEVKDKDVMVLALCVWDEKAAYDKWVTKNIGTTYNFPVAFDPAGRGPKSIAGSLYKVTGIPTQYVIDKDGKVASNTVGYDEGDSRLEASLIKLGVDIPSPQKTASK